MKAYIKALAYNLPEKILDNEQVAAMFPEWTVEKIEKKIGIKERHITAEGETASDLAVGAAEKLFAANNIDRETIDYLIFVTQSPDYHLPTTACLIQTRLGLSKKITAIDVNLGCSGFVTGLSLAKAVVVSGQAKNVLLLTAETYSKYMHERDKSNRTIFGDGSAATLVSTEGMAEIGEFVIGTDGTGAENLIVKSGGARNPKPLNDLVFDDYGNQSIVPTDGEPITGSFEPLSYTIHDLNYQTNVEVEPDILFVFNVKKNDQIVTFKNYHIYDENNVDISKHSLLIYDGKKYLYDSNTDNWYATI